MRSFETYKTYVSIKRHFEQPTYDYFLYNGVSKGLNLEKFLSRRGLPHYFQIFNKRYKKEQLLSFFVANFISDNKMLEDMVNSGDDIFVAWKNRIQSMGYNFETELDLMMSKVNEFDELFQNEEYNPIILKMFYQNDISIETFIIMDLLLSFFTQFDRKLDDYQWPATRDLCNKYKCFLNVDRKKYLQIVKNKLDI